MSSTKAASKAACLISGLAFVLLPGITASAYGQCANGIFAPAKTFPAGEDLGPLAMADFNGDGYLDLVIAHPNQNSISILLGDGRGGFGAPKSYPVNRPLNIAIADFNGDGKPDVAAVDGSAIEVLPGDGNGGFGEAIVSSLLKDDAAWIDTTDFNNDGHADLAEGNPVSFGSVMGDGSGTFKPISFVGVPARCPGPGILVADFNGDGIPDIYVIGYGVTITGELVGIHVDPAGQPLAAADLNGDGKIDLVVTSDECGGRLVSLLGDGKGHFTSSSLPFPPSFSPQSALAADFDGDEKLDLVASNGANLMISLGHGGGSFGGATAMPLAGKHLVLGDFNGDGKPDIATEAVTVLENACSGPCPTSPTAVLTAQTSVCAHSAVTLSIALTGKPPWRLIWSDGVTQSNIFKSPAKRVVFPATSASYRVVSVSDISCFGPASESVFVGPPETSAINVPDSVEAGLMGVAASVVDHPGDSYVWTATDGVITSGQGTHSIVFNSGAAGTLTLSVTETAPQGCSTTVTAEVRVGLVDKTHPVHPPRNRPLLTVPPHPPE